MIAISGNRWTRIVASAVVLAASGCASGSRVGGPPAGAPGPLTRAERSGYLETSRYADVIAFIDSLKGRPELVFGSIGKTSEGRDIPYVVASRPRVSNPAGAKALNRPIVYVQGNIHAGEVEGKEALLALLRDLTSSAKPNVLDSVVLIAVPIYNADGNEKFASQEINRGSQNGPEMVGVRPNAQGLDLNRDYVKVEAPETRASLAMFNAWNPDVFVDLHTTNGSYHGYALTYSPPLNPASPLGAYTRDSILPVLRQRMQVRHGFPTFDYGNFISADTLSKGWVTFDSRPRFATNYYGLRGRISILSEAYSHDPFEKRVKATYAFTREILSLAAERQLRVYDNGRLNRSIAGRTDEDAFSSRCCPRYAVRSKMVAAPFPVPVVAEVIERNGDLSRSEPGVPKGRRRTGRYVTVNMPVYDRFEPTLSVPLPMRYVLRATDTAAVRVLRAHGISVRVATNTFSGADLVGNGYVFRIDSTIVAQQPFQGHREVRVSGKWQSETRKIEPGSFIVDMSQPLSILAAYLLEPQSDDGLVTWNFFDSDLRSGGLYPVFKVGGVPPTP